MHSPLPFQSNQLTVWFQDRYRELMRVSRQWQDIQNRIKSGFGHRTDQAPGDGNLSEFCPACPQPGVNLLPDWHQQPNQ